MTVEKGYYVRRQVGVEEPDPNAIDLYRRMAPGEVVVVPVTPPMKKPGWVFYRRISSDPVTAGILLEKIFIIYFRKPDEEELALITLGDI